MHPSRPSLRGREGRGEGATVFSVYLANKMDHSASLLPIPPFFASWKWGGGTGDRMARLSTNVHFYSVPFSTPSSHVWQIPPPRVWGRKKCNLVVQQPPPKPQQERSVGRRPRVYCRRGPPPSLGPTRQETFFSYSWGGDPKAPSVINWLDVLKNKKLL